MKTGFVGMVVALAIGAASAQDAAGRRLEYRSGETNPFIEHAPLAMFSLGSLAVGAAFYGIQSSLGGSRMQSPGERSSMNMAMAAAGATSLAAGLTYFYYARRDAKRARDWDASLSAGLASDGSMRLTASLPLPFLPLGL